MNDASAVNGSMPDVAIIGAGPAGLAAALTARDAGLAVTVLDEGAAPGGQIYRDAESAGGRGETWLNLLGEDYAKGIDLVRRFRACGADYRPEHAVFDISPDGGLGVIGPAGASWMQARRVVIATGAMERPVAVPGWTLPGVMGAGAAQTLLKSAAMAPDAPTVIAGSGPLIYLVARQLLLAGANLTAVLETTPRGNYRRAAPLLARAMLSGRELRKGLSWRREIKKGVRVFRTGVRSIRIEGTGKAEAVTFAAGGGARRLDCELVLLHEGVVPNVQLSMAAGIKHEFSELQACWRPVADADGRTSVPAILVCGDGAGIAGADLAVEAGRLTGLAAARDLEAISRDSAEQKGKAPRALIARKATLRRFLDTLYRPREEVLAPPDDETMVCRCEEVTAGELRKIAAMGCPGPNQAKAFSRCGMGPCQGRMCALTSVAILARASGRGIAETGHVRIRPPIKPVTVGELAALEGLGPPPDAGPLLPTAPDEASK